MPYGLKLIYSAYLKFTQDDGWAIASHITLSALTSLFPFLIFLTALSGFLGNSEIADAATALLFGDWPREIFEPLSREIHIVLTQPHSGLLTTGAVLSLYFSSSSVLAVRTGLNRAYNIIDIRAWWILRLEAIAYVLIAGLALLLIAFLLLIAPFSHLWQEKLSHTSLFPTSFLYSYLHFGFAIILLAIGIFLTQLFLPAQRQSIAKVTPGVILTFLSWLAFGKAFALYLTNFSSNYVATYAGLASIMIIIGFLYTLAVLFIYFSEINQILSQSQIKLLRDQ
jgi:membrane protein